MATDMQLRERGLTYLDNSRGHTWQRDEGGEIDIWAFHSGKFHNGPKCIACGYGFCHHCENGPEEDCSAQGKTGDDRG